MPPASQPVACETLREAGPDAPWLVLVHGMAQDRRAMRGQAAHFRRTHRICLIDLPGHGASAALPGPYGPREYAEAVLEGMGGAVDGPVHYWGTHTGAGVGLYLAAHHPGRFASLVLEGPVIPGAPPPTVGAMLAEAGRIAREQGVPAAREHWWAQSPWYDVLRAGGPELCAPEHREMLDDFAGGPWLDTTPGRPLEGMPAKLAEITTPALILNGEHDVPDFLGVARQLLGLLPQARHALIPGGGGFPGWEFPQAANAAARDFWAG